VTVSLGAVPVGEKEEDLPDVAAMAGQERLLVVMNVDVGETPSMQAALSVSIAGTNVFSRWRSGKACFLAGVSGEDERDNERGE
jgi:hypothetical protein